MKVGRGSIRPMSKVHKKCASFGRSPLLFAVILIVFCLSLALAGCGELSLTQLLENEEPGEIRIVPEDANLSVGSTIDISATGGFKPYKFSLVPGSPGTIESDSGVYIAPPTITKPGDFDLIEIEATDYFGRIDRGTLNVFEPLSLDMTNATVAVGESIDFTASGGVAPYSYYLDDVLQVEDSATWTFVASTEGSYMLEVLDDIENSVVSRIEVIADTLAIVPSSAYVKINETMTFRALNPTGGFTFRVLNEEEPGTGSITSDREVSPAEYTAPNAPTTDAVILEDTLTSITATVHVLTADPGPLVIAPAALNDALNFADIVVFTVSGGIPPYTFWLEFDSAHGTLEQIAADKARYTAPSANTVDWVWVADELDTSLRVKVRVNK